MFVCALRMCVCEREVKYKVFVSGNAHECVMCSVSVCDVCVVLVCAMCGVCGVTV